MSNTKDKPTTTTAEAVAPPQNGNTNQPAAQTTGLLPTNPAAVPASTHPSGNPHPDVIIDFNPTIMATETGRAPRPPETVPRQAPQSTGDHWMDLQAFIQQTEEANLLMLAAIYLGTDPKKAGFDRKQDEKELAIITIKHLAAQLHAIGWGAQVMKGSVHIFTGKHWRPFLDQDFATALGEFAAATGVPKVIAMSHQFRKNLLKQFKALLRCAPTTPNREQVLINLGNGTLQIDNGCERLRDFRKEDLLTYSLPFDYDEQATCPMFDCFLHRVLPDKSSQEVLAEFFGWAFIRGLKLEKALLLYGEGANGKSVLFDIIRAMLGDQNVTTLGLSMLSKMENRFLLANSLLNYASEFGGRCDTDIFKKMVSGEPLEGRRRYKDLFVMSDVPRFAFNINELPKDIEHTHGFFRRFLIVPFLQRIGPEERNPNLAREIIATELPGVFNWVMEGMRRLRRNQQFTECQAAKQALQTYIEESDTVAMFLKDQGLVASDNNRIPKGTLYEEYRRYCKTAGFSPLTINEFGRGMSKRHGIPDGKINGVRHWRLEPRTTSQE